ncbi:MAG: helix-turn-helix domain-containing protein, partial [Anaerolineales bacterium]
MASPFISIASTRWEIVVRKHAGRVTLILRGPETRPSPALGVDDAEFVGILFKPGAFLPSLPPKIVMDRADLELPRATVRSFRLNSSAWQFPDFENADTFVDRLARDGSLAYDPLVGDAFWAEPVDVSLRTLQRRFLQATGLTRSTMLQIDRARYAVHLLKQGVSILDVVDRAGYFDQPHLSRSLKHFIGLTPAQIADQNRPERLSFLYNTAPVGRYTIQISKEQNE